MWHRDRRLNLVRDVEIGRRECNGGKKKDENVGEEIETANERESVIINEREREREHVSCEKVFVCMS